MPEAKCYLCDIVDPDPETIRPEVWREVQKRMDESKWIGEHGERAGIVSTLAHEVLVTGFFAHEGQKTYLLKK